MRDLIAYLNEDYGTNDTSFLWLDVITDDVPDADAYLITHVFQLPGNQQIQEILGKHPGRSVFVAEHLLTKPVAYNKDKRLGLDVRLYCKSGVCLKHPRSSLSAFDCP